MTRSKRCILLNVIICLIARVFLISNMREAPLSRPAEIECTRNYRSVSSVVLYLSAEIQHCVGIFSSESNLLTVSVY